MRLFPKCYLRVRMGSALFHSQDYPTFFMIRRWIHTYNSRFGVWFPPGKANGTDAKSIEREGCQVFWIKWRTYRISVGKRAWRELFEDILGIHFHGVARKMIRRMPFLKKWEWLKKLAIDEQDWTDFDAVMEHPRNEFMGVAGDGSNPTEMHEM